MHPPTPPGPHFKDFSPFLPPLSCLSPPLLRFVIERFRFDFFSQPLQSSLFLRDENRELVFRPLPFVGLREIRFLLSLVRPPFFPPVRFPPFTGLGVETGALCSRSPSERGYAIL